jgi:hypothetical protein
MLTEYIPEQNKGANNNPRKEIQIVQNSRFNKMLLMLNHTKNKIILHNKL